MKVLILFCGGTIIMQESKEGSLVVAEKQKAIKSLLSLEPRLKEVSKLDVEYVDNIDSSNITGAHWDKIATIIAKKYDRYDGFVITHGTDTMAYTSSALSFALQNLGKPVVITGSQIPGNQIETDARRNFVNAVRLATMDISGVKAAITQEIILGARCSKVSESKLDAFETINWDDLGEIRIDIRLSDEHKPRHNRPLNLQTGYENHIAFITLVPGTEPNLLDLLIDKGIKGLVLRAYGPGDISYDYIASIKKA